MDVLLSAWGCEVEVATSLAVLEDSISVEENCDLLIIDYHLDNEQTGIMVSQEITTKRKSSIPTIMISANYSQSLQEECKQNGIILLNKPVKPLKLRMTMQQCLC